MQPRARYVAPPARCGRQHHRAGSTSSPARRRLARVSALWHGHGRLRPLHLPMKPCGASGIAAPVKIRMASPDFRARFARAPAGSPEIANVARRPDADPRVAPHIHQRNCRGGRSTGAFTSSVNARSNAMQCTCSSRRPVLSVLQSALHIIEPQADLRKQKAVSKLRHQKDPVRRA